MYLRFYCLFVLFFICHSLKFNLNSLKLTNLSKQIAINTIITLSFFSPFYNIALATESLQPTDKDNQLVQVAFRDFDLKRFDSSAKEFSIAIDKWKQLNRPRDEIVSLLKARANVYLDNKQFELAINDDNEALKMMYDGEKDDGTAKYPEYVDTFVSRALAKEGLSDWKGALDDYDKAIKLWGGGRGDNINPYVLTFRGNTLCRLNRYNEAIPDYEAASNIFNSVRDVARYSDARANLALALYQLDNRIESVKIMNDVIRKNPGYTDMHVALAADSWSEGDYITALKEWRFACDKISSGCKAYEDENWLRTVRRWPTKLIDNFEDFLARRLPKTIRENKGDILAPSFNK